MLSVGIIEISEKSFFWDLLVNLTLTNGISGIGYAVPVGWTLAIEEFSYMIIGLT